PFQFAIHSPGPVFCGLLNDMGWPLGPACEQLIEDDAPLERPVLALPGNGIKKSGTTPQLVWNDVNGATSYQVQISKNYTHTDIVFDETSPGTSLTVNSGLSPATIYFWRVRAIGSGSTSSWSSNYRFTTALDIPDTVTLFSPENGAINQPTAVNLFWESINGVDNYILQVATNPNFNSQNLVIERTLKINEFSTSQLIDFSTTYYWRVKASSNIGETDWSETWSFTTIIERPLAVTAFITPVNDEVQVPVTTQFNWEPSERASDYTIQISTDEDFSTVPISGFVSNSQFTNDDPLDFAEVYYWRVRASNIGGESNWSETNRFITEVQETKISDNYPNPFDIFTTLRYQLSEQRHVLVDVFDMTGRRVSVLVDGEQGPGVYFESLHANHFASGIYMIRFVAGDVMDVQKMTIIK
ncbi:MAG: T9SS type A sorting domain-containing protein, partial [Balneolaceae bacterium]